MNKRLPLSAGTVLQLRYTIVGQLGHGGMGAVYEARDNRTSATVALKETYADDDYTRNAFEREAKMLANMTHEAFPRVMDYFAEGDGFYLVMELIRGKDLSELLEERNAPFETEQVLEWADQILDALEDLHSQDIVHRDIKPSNLKLTPRGRIKLLDFGIAKGAAGDMTAIQITDNSMAAASLQYAPLEQVLRADPNYYDILSVHYTDKVEKILQIGTDAGSDLYALGATAYHLLTKHLPVNAPTRALAVWSGQADKQRPVHEINPKVPQAISAILQKAMELDRKNRPQTAAEMRRMVKLTENKKGNISYIAKESQLATIQAPQAEVETHVRPLQIRSSPPQNKPNQIRYASSDLNLPPRYNRPQGLIRRPRYNTKQKAIRGGIFVACLGSIIGIGIIVSKVNNSVSSSDTHFKNAVECMNKAEYGCALSNYDWAIKLKPNEAAAYYNRAMVYEKLGNMEKAKADRAKYAELTKKQ